MSPVRPVRRRVLLLALAGTVLALVAAIEGVDLLRHPPAGGEPEVAEVDLDPRAEITCPEPPPPGSGSAIAARDPVGSAELYDCPAAWDGQPVRYVGEVVGAVLRRGDHAWVHLNDDVYAGARGPLPAHRDYQGGNAGIGIRVPAALAEEITWVGGSRVRGDVVEVRGTFLRVHPDSREPAVIVATTGAVVRTGGAFVDPVLPDRAIAAALLSVLAVGLVVAERVVARKRR